MTILDMLLDGLLDTTESKANNQASFGKSVKDLLSGKEYEVLLNVNVKTTTLDNQMLLLDVCKIGARMFLNASKSDLQTLDEETRKTAIAYLENLRGKYNDFIDLLNAKIADSKPKEKTLDNMSKEELLEFIKTKFQ